ncbi:hypothetical protein JCM10213_003090 [Rhodosporidiobolus nylandii]
MRTAFIAASLASIASVAVAQTGYGRFPCTIVNGDGTFSADQNQCADANLIAPGSGDGVPGEAAQGDTPSPTNAQCVEETETGAYFCGIAGAACGVDANCDNGICVDGICQGGFEQDCAANDVNCSGYLYCLDAGFGATASNTCGGIGAYCQDATVGDTSQSQAFNQALFDQFCGSGYCNYGTAVCDTHGGLGDDCSTDPDFYCGTGLQCNTATYQCEIAAVPSAARARARRDEMNGRRLARRNLCPAQTSACAVDGGRGFECINTSTNIEQCGGCASAGGVDCTALPSVSAVGCVAGVCEIWSCEEGFNFDAASNSCI